MEWEERLKEGLIQYMPSRAWGDRKQVQEWMERGGLEGREKEKQSD